MKKIVLPKINLKGLDWSKWNFRKFNWLTVLGIMCYLNVLIIFPIVFGRKSEFVKYHVRQGLALDFVFILFVFSFYLPLLPWFFALLLVVCVIFGVVNVSRGFERKLPVIGHLAK